MGTQLSHMSPPASAQEASAAHEDPDPSLPSPSSERGGEQDSPMAWCICAATFVVFFVALGQIYAFAVLYKAILDDLNSSEGLTAVMFGIATGIMNGFGIFSGILLSKFGYKTVALMGGVMLTLGNVSASFAQTVPQLIGAYGVVLGTGVYLSMAAALPMVNLWFTEHRSLASGVAMSGSGFGMMIVAPLLQLVVDQYDWRMGFRALAALSLVTVAVGPLLYRLPAEHADNAPQEVKQTAVIQTPLETKQEIQIEHNKLHIPEQKHQQQPGPHGDHLVLPVTQDRVAQPVVRPLFDWLLFKDPVYRVLACSFLLCSLGYFVPFAFAVRLAEDKGFSNAEGSMLLTMMGIANTVGRLVAGRVGDLVDRRMLFASCMLIGGANVMFLGFDIPYWLLALLLVVFSVFGGAFVAMFPVLVTDSFGAKRVSSTIGMLMATVAPGALVGSPLVGFLYTATGDDYRLPFILTGLFLILGGCTSLVAKRFLDHPEHIEQINAFA